MQQASQGFLCHLLDTIESLARDRRYILRCAPGFHYRGFEYNYDLETMSDCQKIYHEIKDLSTGKTVHMDWSPYDTPTEDEFRAWVELGCPERVGCGPLRTEDLVNLLKGKVAA